jgi:hypothetical protein
MAELSGQQSELNAVSEETGQFDPRFVLWRIFCADQGVPVDSLPSDLCGEAKEQWETIKESEVGSTRD